VDLPMRLGPAIAATKGGDSGDLEVQVEEEERVEGEDILMAASFHKSGHGGCMS